MEKFTDMQWMGKFIHNIQLDTRINKWGGGVGPLLVMECDILPPQSNDEECLDGTKNPGLIFHH